MLKTKLKEIRENKALMKKKYEDLTKQREQAERNYIALDGAEQVLLELIEISECDTSCTALEEPETEIIEEVSTDDASDND